MIQVYFWCLTYNLQKLVPISANYGVIVCSLCHVLGLNNFVAPVVSASKPSVSTGPIEKTNKRKEVHTREIEI